MPIWIFGAVSALLLAAAAYSSYEKQRFKRQIREISGKLEEILDHDTEEKVMLFTDQPELKALLTQLNRLLNDRQRQKAEYQRTELASRHMLSNISHDMKTPLTVILGYLEILRLEEPWKDNAMLQKVEEKAKQVMELISQFFTLAKIEAGDMEPEYRKLDLGEVCRRNLLDFYDILTEKEFQVVPRIPEEPICLYGDEQALNRILFNLLSNAVRYGGDGKYVGLSLEPCGDDVRIKVTDKGHGIAEEHLKYIFERLYTQEDSRSRRAEGSGIGLSIVKTLTEQMGGRVSVKSVPGVETVFTVCLPRNG